MREGDKKGLIHLPLAEKALIASVFGVLLTGMTYKEYVHYPIGTFFISALFSRK